MLTDLWGDFADISDKFQKITFWDENFTWDRFSAIAYIHPKTEVPTIRKNGGWRHAGFSMDKESWTFIDRTALLSIRTSRVGEFFYYPKILPNLPPEAKKDTDRPCLTMDQRMNITVLTSNKSKSMFLSFDNHRFTRCMEYDDIGGRTCGSIPRNQPRFQGLCFSHGCQTTVCE